MPSSDGKSIGGENNHYFSMNIGPIHLVSFSTEFYYFLEYGFKQVKTQYEWLERDLQVFILIFRNFYDKHIDFFVYLKRLRKRICLKIEQNNHV